MMEELSAGGFPLTEICVGAVVLFVILVVIVFLMLNRPFTYHKRTHEKNTTLTIVAKKNLHRVTVTARFDKDQITFERKRVRRGQMVDFTYPASDIRAKVVVEVGAGKKPRTFEV